MTNDKNRALSWRFKIVAALGAVAFWVALDKVLDSAPRVSEGIDYENTVGYKKDVDGKERLNVALDTIIDPNSEYDYRLEIMEVDDKSNLDSVLVRIFSRSVAVDGAPNRNGSILFDKMSEDKLVKTEVIAKSDIAAAEAHYN